MTVGEALVKILKDIGMDTVAGIPGSYILPLFEAFRKQEMKTLLLYDEAAAGIIADGYYKVSRRPLILCATAGPGAVRLADGLYVPMTEKSACFSITGMVPTDFIGKGALQEACGGKLPDQNTYLNESCKFSRVILEVEEFESALHDALNSLFSFPSGPVNLTIPVNILNENFKGDTSKFFQPANTSLTNEDPVKLAGSIAEEIKKSSQPLLLAGSGVFNCRGGELLERFASTTGIPVATTLRGKGVVDELNPIVLGCVGMFGQNAANKYLRESDLVVVLGASLGEMTTQAWDPGFFNGKQIILLDVNHAPTDFPVKSKKTDIKLFLESLIGIAPPARDDLPEIAMKLKSKFKQFERVNSGSYPLNPVEVIDEIRDFYTENSFLVTESITWTERWLPASQNRFITDGNAATLGYSAAAIGVKLALPESTVFSVSGDGGFRYCIGSLEISRRYNLPVIWIILNNGCMAAIRDGQLNLFGKSFSCDYDDITDFTVIARGFGVKAARVETREELNFSLNEALKSNETWVIDVLVSDVAPPHKPAMGKVAAKNWKQNPAGMLNPYAFKTLANSKGEI